MVSSHVTITAQKKEPWLVITFQDSGIGMPPEVQAHIFDKFYQGDTSHHMEGNGLGLPLVKRILELHKGNVAVQSQVGGGSVFIVTIPNPPFLFTS